MIGNYEETIEQLRNFQELRLNRIHELEAGIDTITKSEVVEIYEMLQQTKLHIQKLRSLMEA